MSKRRCFIFELIESKSVCFNKGLINLFIKLIEEDPLLRFFLGDLQNASFILANDNAREIYGGALLIKKKLSLLPSKIREGLKSFSLPEGDIWTSTICFHLKNNNFSSEFEIYFQELYQNLYEMISHFGSKKETSILYMVLQPGEYICSEVIGAWPYRLEIRATESSDGLFHGILPLMKKHQPRFIKSTDEKVLFSFNQVVSHF